MYPAEPWSSTPRGGGQWVLPWEAVEKGYARSTNQGIDAATSYSPPFDFYGLYHGGRQGG